MKELRICLVNAGVRTLYSSLVSPPLGILYIAAYLREKFDVKIIVINQKLDNISDTALAEKIASLKADIVGISVMTPSAWLLTTLSKKIRCLLPQALIVAGGAHISGLGAPSLRDTDVDLGVKGEGEVTFAMIVERYLSSRVYDDIPGLIIRDKNGMVSTNKGKVPVIENLDNLPFPAYDLIDISKYWKVQSMLPVPGRKYISLFSSRGCPYPCIYCHKIFDKKYRTHSAERIVDEIDFYRKTFKVDEIEFVDDIFNLDRKRLIEFCTLLKKRNINIKIAFPNGVRTDIFKKDELDALVDAGMYMTSLALESGSKRIQTLSGKGLNIPKFLENVEYIAKKGVFANGFAMFGFPGETAAEMQETIDTACRSKLHSISFFSVTPYPGTLLYENLIKGDCGLPEQNDFHEITCCNATMNLSAEPDHVLMYYQRKANRAFYLNPVRIGRLLRDYPRPFLMPLYLPEFLKRMTKGTTIK